MYSNLIGLESTNRKSAFSRGTLVARWLALYYYNKMRPRDSRLKLLMHPIYWTQKIQTELKWDQNEAFNLYRTLISYDHQFKNDGWKPLAVEKGFSKILHEDDENLFVYEGRPDLIAEANGKRIAVDHKTRSASHSIYEHNNQVLGYLWAGQATCFVYNYLTLTKTPKFERAPFEFYESQIQAWVENTRETFFRIKADVVNSQFLKTLQCQTKYGVCDFAPVCEQPKDSVKLHILNSNFKKRNYRSW
jgi:hypothetical protein